MTPLIWVLAAYFAGSLPTSFLVGKMIGGMDLRREGSGNLGATNVYRAMGLRVAVPVGLVDVGKGWLPAWLFPMLDGGAADGWAAAYGAAAILGHTFSCWVRFRGGKGVATAAGAFLRAVAARRVGRRAGLGARPGIAGASYRWRRSRRRSRFRRRCWLGMSRGRRGGSLGHWVCGSWAGAFVVWAHRSNIGRLLRGEEKRIHDDRRARRGEGG